MSWRCRWSMGVLEEDGTGMPWGHRDTWLRWCKDTWVAKQYRVRWDKDEDTIVPHEWDRAEQGHHKGWVRWQGRGVGMLWGTGMPWLQQHKDARVG